MSKSKPFFKEVFEFVGHTKTEAANKVSQIHLTFKASYNYDDFIKIFKRDNENVRVTMKHEHEPERADFKGAKMDSIFGLTVSKSKGKNPKTVIVLSQEYNYTKFSEMMKFNEFNVNLSFYVVQEKLIETATEEEQKAPL